MARSIHDNRSRRLWIAQGFVDWAEIAKKRRVKAGVRRERTGPVSDGPAARAPSSVPIGVVDSGEPLFYPASVDDIRSVLSRLPSGSVDGLHSITLRSGTLYVNAEGSGGDPDPFLGRRSVEVFTGIYAPVILGAYSRESAEIAIFAFVRAPGAEVADRDSLELRFRMLSTLVHEVAHHFDRIRRTARGRWRMDDVPKAESFAGTLARRWCIECVVPYLIDRYDSA